MDKLLAFIYFISPMLTLCYLVLDFVSSYRSKRESEAKQLRERRRKEHAEDCFRAGAAVRLERWKRKVNRWKPSTLQDALLAGAKRIDEMRAN